MNMTLQEAGGRLHTHIVPHQNHWKPSHWSNNSLDCEVKGASHYDIDKFIDLEAIAEVALICSVEGPSSYVPLVL